LSYLRSRTPTQIIIRLDTGMIIMIKNTHIIDKPYKDSFYLYCTDKLN